MNSSAYGNADIEMCKRKNHHFLIVGSDKTPLKRHVICRTCTEQSPGKTIYVAYSTYDNNPTASFGQWHRPEHDRDKADERSIS